MLHWYYFNFTYLMVSGGTILDLPNSLTDNFLSLTILLYLLPPQVCYTLHNFIIRGTNKCVSWLRKGVEFKVNYYLRVREVNILEKGRGQNSGYEMTIRITI